MKPSRISLVAAAVIAGAVCASCGGPGTTTVPNAKGNDPETAYRLLQRAGLRISSDDFCFTHWIAYGSGCAGAYVAEQSPRPGGLVDRGSEVVIKVVGPNQFHTAIPHQGAAECNSQPKQMPDLRGQPLSQVFGELGCLSTYSSQLPPLSSADKANMFDNYRVTHQSPAPGVITEVSGSNPPGYPMVTVQVELAE